MRDFKCQKCEEFLDYNEIHKSVYGVNDLSWSFLTTEYL